jgi:signal transduction histidine kinase
MTRDGSVDAGTWFLDEPPTSRQSRSALTAIAVLVLAFVVLVPFAGEPLPHFNGFIPAVDAMIFITDFITSALLLSHFSIYPSRALLALASGYLFTALIVIPHALAFAGAFPPIENLGGGPQTTLRLYLIWHLALPAALLVYVWLNNRRGTNAPMRLSTQSAIGLSAVSVLCLVCGFVWIDIVGDKFLPSFYVGNPNEPGRLWPWVTQFPMLICVLALAALWARRRSALDQWLIVVAFASIVELALTARFGNAPFSLGFYTGRIFSLVTSTVVLTVMLVETTNLYSRLVRSNMALERERENKLMNVQAVIAAIAHEVRQPIGAITLNADAAHRWLQRTPPGQEEAREALNEVKKEGLRVSEVFDGLRALFGKVDQDRQSVDVNDIILSVFRSLEGQLNDHGVAVHRELTAELPPIAGHSGQLREVILNLVSNALEAMRSTTNRSRVLHVRTEVRERDTIAVAIKDTGPGIDPKKLAGIFGAFFTTKTQGTGLGLAICHMIVERHGGQLTASSDGESGALFQFTLPIEGTKT